MPQSSNLCWMAISVCKSFGPAKRTGLSKCFQQYPTTFMWVSNQVLLIIDYCGFTCGLRLRLKNRQYQGPVMKLTHRLRGIVGIVLTSPFPWHAQNLCWLSLAFIIDWQVVTSLAWLRSPPNKDTASFSLCQIKEMAIVNIPGLLQQKLSPKQPHLRQLPQQLRAAASSKSHYSLTAIAACGERIKRLSAPTPSLPPSGEMI